MLILSRRRPKCVSGIFNMKTFPRLLPIATCFVLLCCKPDVNPPKEKPFSKVMVFCSVGYDIISAKMQEDIEELITGVDASERTPFSISEALPEKGTDMVLLSIVHFPEKFGHFCDTDPSYLIQYSFDKERHEIVRDTLKTYSGLWLTEPSTLNSIFKTIEYLYPSDHYGLVFSSHGTGCLPPLYTQDHDTRSIGYELGPNLHAHEMDIRSFPSAVALRLDYLILDACFMGGIEPVYEFSDMAPYIVASPAIVPSTGFDYSKLLSRLLCDGEPDVKGVAQDYFHLYADKGLNACVSMVKTAALPSLAALCKEIFAKYADKFPIIKGSDVQPMTSKEMRWLYDFGDIVRKCPGISQSDKDRFQMALDDVVVYKDSTPGIDDFNVVSFCGLNSLLPSAADEQLKAYYRTLAWNKDTGFIQ